MSSLSQLVLHVKRARAALQRRRKSESKKNHNPFRHSAFPSVSTTSVLDRVNIVPTSSPWDVLPVEVQIKIFTQCGIRDFVPLKLVCQSFNQLLTAHEQLITRHYLRQRRHGTLPSPIDSERTYTRNPEDDVVLLSDLFPPAKSAKGGHLYTFRYVYSLQRRQNLCSRLCYYIADRVMDRFVHREPVYMRTLFQSRSERNDFVRRGTARIMFHLMPLMFYVLYFLEAYSLARREHTNALLRDFEAGRLPVPIPPDVGKSMYRELQKKIIQSPPFTNTDTLISTNHCMSLLVCYLQYTVPPDETTVPDDSWIGSLLTVSPFVRIVEYFSAEIGDGGSQRMQRKDFMHNFHHDITLNEQDKIKSLVFQKAPNEHLHNSLQDVWFDIVRKELASRGVGPHDAERIMVREDLPILFGCEECRESVGWQA
ncbi:F-box domain protein [Aspergillus taichungensis]|uniref:F-box domain protein n=1 Tax=Aspergillus taichungensis TaxID=482145 RepID=A0A2J5I706_9EURO|nr:F-box domain protein [Aspergillus taichungensis]